MDQQDKKQQQFTAQEVVKAQYFLSGHRVSLMKQFKEQGGYRINMDGSVSSYKEVMAERA